MVLPLGVGVVCDIRKLVCKIWELLRKTSAIADRVIPDVRGKRPEARGKRPEAKCICKRCLPMP